MLSRVYFKSFCAKSCSERKFITGDAVVNSILDLQDSKNYRADYFQVRTYFVRNLGDNETAEKRVINTEARIN